MRRSRTESSGAAPAIEELPGIARQCKAREGRVRICINRLGLSHGRKRSGGRPALQLPRASNPCGSSNIHLRPARAPQESEIPVSVLSSPIRRGLEGARPSSSPGHQPLAEARISASALTAHRRSRKFSPRYCFPRRRGLEGARPSSSPGH